MDHKPLFRDQRSYEALLRQVRDLPSLPDMVEKVLKLLESPEIPASEVAKIISYDPGLTTKFLRMVNSAAYGFQRQISSVQHAIMILGFSSVRGIVVSTSIFKLFQDKSDKSLIKPSEFWRHSIRTGIGARVIAMTRRMAYSEDAFSAGMLHDLGKMVLSHYFSGTYSKVLEEARQTRTLPHGEAFLALEREYLGSDHAELGHHLALKWRLPVTIAAAVRYHHAPEDSAEAQDLVYAVALANAFSHIMDWNSGVFDMRFIPLNLIQFFTGHKTEEAAIIMERLFKEVQEEMVNAEGLLSSLTLETEF